MTHTWEIYVRYHLCPKCSQIIESREDYHYRLGEQVKTMTCPHCYHTWTEKKKTEEPLGPIFGKPPKPEFFWK